MTRELSSLALIVVALLAGFSSGCSAGLEPLEKAPRPSDKVAPPPLLDVISPRAMSYGAADDGADAAGFQLDVIVTVNDLENGLALETLAVTIGGETFAVPVMERAAGRVAVLEGVTLPAPSTATVSIDAGLDVAGANHTITLRVLEEQPALPDCAQPVAISGDVIVQNATDLGALAGECSVVGGDLIVEGSELEALTALSSVLEIGGNLVIRNNPRLTRIGTIALEAVGGDVIIEDNPVLPAIEVDAVLEHLAGAIGGDVLVDDNGI